MTYDEKAASWRQVSLNGEERAYLLKLMELDLHYHAILTGHSRASQKSRDRHLFLRTLQEKLNVTTL